MFSIEIPLHSTTRIPLGSWRFVQPCFAFILPSDCIRIFPSAMGHPPIICTDFIWSLWTRVHPAWWELSWRKWILVMSWVSSVSSMLSPRRFNIMRDICEVLQLVLGIFAKINSLTAMQAMQLDGLKPMSWLEYDGTFQKVAHCMKMVPTTGSNFIKNKQLNRLAGGW